jgi:predicted ATP-grasp superfamily ATP-dependent carboligase
MLLLLLLYIFEVNTRLQHQIASTAASSASLNVNIHAEHIRDELITDTVVLLSCCLQLSITMQA